MLAFKDDSIPWLGVILAHLDPISLRERNGRVSFDHLLHFLLILLSFKELRENASLDLLRNE